MWSVKASRKAPSPYAPVLSGNRNFEGRVHPEVENKLLASPPLVVAYAIAGTMDIDLYNDAFGTDQSGASVYLKDIWPTQWEINDMVLRTLDPAMFSASYESCIYGGCALGRHERAYRHAVPVGPGIDVHQESPLLRWHGREPPKIHPVNRARVLALLGDSITTDHISPAGSIKVDSPAGRYLIERGVQPRDFNSYGARRGNHEVMMRGTFANIRLRNRLAPGTEGGWTRYQPSGEQLSIYDAAVRYQDEGVPLLIIGGKEYGTGSSRDWAAKGTRLLGVRAVLAESFERIHRSNLVGMGVLPLTFKDGQNAETLGLTGAESYDIEEVKVGAREVTVVAFGAGGRTQRFSADVRVDTPKEWEYYQHSGILPYVLRQLAG